MGPSEEFHSGAVSPSHSLGCVYWLINILDTWQIVRQRPLVILTPQCRSKGDTACLPSCRASIILHPPSLDNHIKALIILLLPLWPLPQTAAIFPGEFKGYKSTNCQADDDGPLLALCEGQAGVRNRRLLGSTAHSIYHHYILTTFRKCILHCNYIKWGGL